MRRNLLLLITTLLIGLLLPGGQLYASQPAVRSIPVGADAIHLQSDGRFVIWLEGWGSDRTKLYAASLADGRPFLIADGITPPEGSDTGSTATIGNGIVAWTQGSGAQRTLYARTLPAGPTVTVASGSHIDLPAISGTTIAWWSHTTGGAPPNFGKATLKTRDLVSLAEPSIVTQVDETIYGFRALSMSKNWIAWSQGIAPQHQGICWRLSAISVGGGELRHTSGEECHNGEFLLAGDTLIDTIYHEHYPPTMRFVFRTYNLATKEGGASPHGQQLGSDSGNERFVFWNARSNGFSSSKLLGYDHHSKSMFQISASAATTTQSPASLQPALAGELLCWIDRGEIVVRSLAELLPNAPEPAPQDPGQRWFPETQHTLAGTFRSYWEQRGGLPIFGFTITEPFSQTTADSVHQDVPVQYLERQRFEHHAKNAGTPYEVLLGRLGAEELARRGRDWRKEPKAAPGAPHYQAETGHAIAPEFWGYWSGHGLDFGDAGVSFRESLALFGYPLTEPALEINSSGDRVLTQWFERARFEYHPGNPEPYKVLLGRLGAEVVESWGWR